MESSHTPIRIGLTGGIGSGKSTVAATWRQDGHRVIDLDVHSRAVLDVPGEGVEEAVARFGQEYRNSAGTIDRAAMARLVFADAAARADLERIVLTRVDRAAAQEEAEARAAGEPLVIHDNPLLLEKRGDGDYDAIIAILARREDRIARVMTGRDRERDYVVSVMAAQVTDLDRIRRADRLVLNNAGRHELAERARHALRSVLEARDG